MKYGYLRLKLKVLCKIIRFSKTTDKNRKKILALGVIVGVLREGTILTRTFLPALIIDLIINREMISCPVIVACGISVLLSSADYIIEGNLRKISNLSVSSVSYKILSLNKRYMTMRYDIMSTTEAYKRYDRATDAVWEISDTEYIIYSQMLPKILSLFTLISVFWNIDFVAALITCSSVVIDLLLGKKIEDINFKAREQISESERNFSHLLSNLLDPIYSRDLQAYNSEKLFSKQMEDFRLQHIKAIGDREKKKFKYSLISQTNNFFRLLVIYLFALYKFVKGTIPIGNFLLYINASNSLSNTLQQMKNEVLFLGRVISYYEDIESFESNHFVPQNCDLESQLSDSTSADNCIPEIEFVNVSFTYPNQDRKALDNISVKIFQNEKIALVGENGSGKSTLVKLLLKLYTPDEGKILLRGKNINEINDDEYFKLFAPVFQDFQLLAYTIRENVGFTVQEKEKVLKALSQANLKNKVLQLSKGIDTYYTTRFDEAGVEFSGGEQQLLALARSLYKNSPIMILDEPTAALDPLKEKAIFDLFATQSNDKTTIYISHRMSASRIADRVLFLKKGKLCESGTHEFLVKENGEYAKLWHMQAQWYIL